MLPEAKDEILVYATGLSRGGPGLKVHVYSYRSGKLVGLLTGLSDAAGACSDGSGNVFITNRYKVSSTYEYAHGGHDIIATYRADSPVSCAWDPGTNSLAVCGSSVSIFKNEQAKRPTIYNPPISPAYCTYDGNGNLFLDGGLSNGSLWELPKGSGSFISIADDLSGPFGSLQWDGEYLALNVPTGKPDGSPATVYQLSVQGSQASVVSKTLLYSARGDTNYDVNCQMWIQNGAILAGQRLFNRLAAWSYPGGGKPTKIFAPKPGLCGITVSVPPAGARFRE
jgi:WD40 repeat protein